MVRKFLLDILVDPFTREKLKYDTNGDTLSTDSGHHYQILEGVPVLIPQEIYDTEFTSSLHTANNSSFRYAEHYKIDAEVNNYFEKPDSAASRDEIHRIHQAVIDSIPKDAEMILDAGCGGAWLSGELLPLGKKVVSMDISFKNPVEAIKRYPSENHAAIIADSLNPPLREGSFDVIVASEILEHLYDPKLFIEKMASLLKPGGKLIIETPYNEKLTYHLCIHCNKPTPSNAHLHSFNEKNIINYLPEGVVIVKKKVFNNKLFIKSRFYATIHFLPFAAWDIIDRTVNKLLNRPSVLLIELSKLSKS